MSVSFLKKKYNNNKISIIVKEKSIVYFLQYQNLTSKEKQILIFELQKLNFKLKIMKNNSNFFVTTKKIKLFTQSRSCLIYYDYLIKNKNDSDITLNLFLSLHFIKKFKLFCLILKYQNKIFTSSNIKKLFKYNTKNKLYNMLFFNFKQIVNPNLNLIKKLERI